MLKVEPGSLKPLLMVPKAVFEEFGKLKPMFCGDCAANPIFWIRVGLLKDGDVDNVLS